MKLLTLSAADLRHVLPMPEAVRATLEAYAALSGGRAVQPQRAHLAVTEHEGQTLVMPAYLPGTGLGAKLVSVFPRNAEEGRPVIHGLVVLLDPRTGAPEALVDGTFLTAWRTAAATGAGVSLLARKEAKVAALFGCGAQAATQAEALDAVRELDTIRVFAPRPESVRAFARRVQPRVRARIEGVASPAAAVERADVVVCATSSSEPVFKGERLAPGAHVGAVGTFTSDARELDGTTVARATVFVDSLSAALAEAGDLVLAAAEGRTRPEDWTELGAVAGGAAAGRTSAEEITLFKSVGLGVQDVACAAAAVARARELGLGREIEL